MTEDIITSLEGLLKTLNQCKTQETDGKTIQLYNVHINLTSYTLDKLKTNGLNETLIKNFFEQEGHGYGWSYLPNENGRIAEEAFWNLKKKLGYK